MKRSLIVCCLLIAAACSHSRVMTDETYADINIGTPIALVEQNAGKPWRVEASEEGVGSDYIYVQRRNITPRREQHIHYIFQVDDEGIVFDKKRRLLQDEALVQWEIN